MIEAFVFVNTEIGAEDEVMETLIKLPEVESVLLVYGPYDLVVKVKANSAEELRKVISEKIRKLPKIKSTTTLIIARSIIK